MPSEDEIADALDMLIKQKETAIDISWMFEYKGEQFWIMLERQKDGSE